MAAFFVVFGLSGAFALVYEVLWVRQFALLLGASSYAVTTILASFMAGLALGAFWIGRRADRLNQESLARWYAGLELGIGGYALLLPLLMEAARRGLVLLCAHLEPGPWAFNAIRIGISFGLLLAPTMLMGATLPVLARYVIRTRAALGPVIGRLYAVNTLGALVGVMATGYCLLPSLGIRLANGLAASGNFAVAAFFWWMHRRLQTRTKSGQTPASRAADVAPSQFLQPTLLQSGAVWAFGLSGAAAMIYQVTWTRVLSMILGTTTYAFTTIVAMYLLGIAVGSLLYGRLRRWGSPAGLLAGLQLGAAFSGLLTLPLLEKLPFLFLSLQHHWIESWLELQLARSLLSALTILLPTLALGAMLPAVAEVFVDGLDVLGRRLGRAYAANTMGAVAGTVGAGLLLIPAVGLQATIVLGAMLNLLAGAVVLLLRPQLSFPKRLLQAMASVLVMTAGILLLNPWSPQVMSSGVYAYADRYLRVIKRADAASDSAPTNPWRLWEEAMRQFKVLFHRSGPAATVTVMEDPEGIRFLSVDGKTDASTSLAHDMKTQTMLGQLPMLVHPRARSIFVVGLGSGVTAGAVLTHPVERVVCAEFSSAVIEAAAFFDEANGGTLLDPRLHLVFRDARNALLTTTERFDVIVAQPSNPWISGQSALFSKEWYETVKAHLNPDGLFAQWLPAYAIDPGNLRTLIHTLRFVFPGVTAWSSGAAGDVIFLAPREGTLALDLALARQRFDRELIQEDFGRLGFAPEDFPERFFLMGPGGLRDYLARGPQPLPLNTDNRLVTEFSTPRSKFYHRTAPRFVEEDELRRPRLDELTPLVLEQPAASGE